VCFSLKRLQDRVTDFISQSRMKWPVIPIKAFICLLDQAPVERLFSIAGKIFRPDRCLLTDTTFETLLLIKCNNWTFKQHCEQWWWY
jgi:hypothetical protein